MTENRRIFWNVVATYGRSMYSLVLGLITARWVFGALGVSDYGLYGVVGGMTGFISFFNSTLAAANSRFYAYSVGQARAAADKDAALEECRRWFNTALTIHTVVPLALISVGFPLGMWAVRNFLTIPADRVDDCSLVFCCVCVTCFASMVSVPFNAMYRAKQYIAELTIYTYVCSTINAFFLYYMITHPGVWLVKYAIWHGFISLAPQLIICLRAMVIFPECRIRREYMFEKWRLKKILGYSTWQLLGTICSILRNQGSMLVYNKFFGVAVNAAQSLGGSVNEHTSRLCSSLTGSFSPAITVAYGAGDFERMQKLVVRSCKFAALSSLVFAIPLVAVLDDVLILWLKTPPPFTVFFTVLVLFEHLVNSITQGPTIAIAASGDIRDYNINIFYLNVLTLPLALAAAWMGGGVYGVGCVLGFMTCVLGLRRIYYAKRFGKVSRMLWVRKALMPVVVIMLISVPVAYGTRISMSPGFVRIMVTTVVCLGVMLPCMWRLGLDMEEREYVGVRIRKLWNKVFE